MGRDFNLFLTDQKKTKNELYAKQFFYWSSGNEILFILNI